MCCRQICDCQVVKSLFLDNTFIAFQYFFRFVCQCICEVCSTVFLSFLGMPIHCARGRNAVVKVTYRAGQKPKENVQNRAGSVGGSGFVSSQWWGYFRSCDHACPAVAPPKCPSAGGKSISSLLSRTSLAVSVRERSRSIVCFVCVFVFFSVFGVSFAELS